MKLDPKMAFPMVFPWIIVGFEAQLLNHRQQEVMEAEDDECIGDEEDAVPGIEAPGRLRAVLERRIGYFPTRK